jgi:hypothetical protein
MSGIAGLSQQARSRIVEAVVSRHGLRSTVRLTGIPQNRVKALLMQLGPACTRYQDETLRSLAVAPIEWREALAFRAKAENTTAGRQYSLTTGSVWTLTCLDTRTKLVPTWRIGAKSIEALDELHADVAWRYGPERDAQIAPSDDLDGTGSSGDLCHICRAWFSGLERGFARKVERHAAAVALYFMHYNFSSIRLELGTTPAIAAGRASHVWCTEEIVDLLSAPSAIRCTDESAPRPK